LEFTGIVRLRIRESEDSMGEALTVVVLEMRDDSLAGPDQWWHINRIVLICNPSYRDTIFLSPI
jgi:hypothetical protein